MQVFQEMLYLPIIRGVKLIKLKRVYLLAFILFSQKINFVVLCGFAMDRINFHIYFKLQIVFMRVTLVIEV